MRVCAFCGEATPEGDRRCRGCGKELAEVGANKESTAPPRGCRRCGGLLSEGFLASNPIGYMARKTTYPPVSWHGGPARWSDFWGYLRGAVVHPVQAYRCEDCASLEFFAHES